MNKKYMQIAIDEAQKAYKKGEVPVGAVIVKNGEIIAQAHNTRETERSALGHAEINAVKTACEKLDSWRLDGCEIYVTMEPCPMCAGAIINARISTVVFGSYDLKMGSFDSVVNLATLDFGFKPEIYGGICEQECTALVKNFFEELRNED
ncbi:MAG: nucleoside deaminase [Acutalibacteraceae bacterium]|nr:nucleoside deaminase [Acutalibacteraceae bacterium]